MFICNFDFQYKPKATIMLNSMLPLVRIMNIMKTNNVKSIKKCMDIDSGSIFEIYQDMQFLSYEPKC